MSKKKSTSTKKSKSKKSTGKGKCFSCNARRVIGNVCQACGLKQPAKPTTAENGTG